MHIIDEPLYNLPRNSLLLVVGSEETYYIIEKWDKDDNCYICSEWKMFIDLGRLSATGNVHKYKPEQLIGMRLVRKGLWGDDE